MRRNGILVMAVAAVLAALPVRLGAASLRPETVSGWDAYARTTEARIADELASATRFLVHDFSPAPETDRAAVMGGQVGVVKMTTVGPAGRTIDVPDGLVHHWRGSIYIPGVTLDRILERVADPRPGDMAQDEVLASRVLDRGPGSLRLYLRLQRTQVVTVVYNTEHAVRYTRLDARRAASRSIATRIAEVAEPATPREWERPLGEDRGFLWRLNSYWRYEAIGPGVLVECESISLSRSVPPLVRGAVQPLIDQVARASMERTLTAMRARFTRASSLGE